MELPEPYNPNNRAFQHQVGESLRTARLDRPTGSLPEEPADAAPVERRPAFLAAEAHPVADCPDRDAHLRSAVQAERVDRELEDLRRQVRGRTESLARRFDRVLRLLEAWGYLDGWALTTSGQVLARTYHESDLLVAEAMTTGVLDDLDAPSLAALVSCFTYEHRGRDRPPEPRFPSSTVRERFHDPATPRRRPGRRRGGRRTAHHPRPRRPGSSTSPTPGRRAMAWPPCSRTRSSRAATSSAT